MATSSAARALPFQAFLIAFADDAETEARAKRGFDKAWMLVGVISAQTKRGRWNYSENYRLMADEACAAIGKAVRYMLDESAAQSADFRAEGCAYDLRITRIKPA